MGETFDVTRTSAAAYLCLLIRDIRTRARHNVISGRAGVQRNNCTLSRNFSEEKKKFSATIRSHNAWPQDNRRPDNKPTLVPQADLALDIKSGRPSSFKSSNIWPRPLPWGSILSDAIPPPPRQSSRTKLRALTPGSSYLFTGIPTPPSLNKCLKYSWTTSAVRWCFKKGQ